MLLGCLSPSFAYLYIHGTNLTLGPIRNDIIWQTEIDEANFTLVNLALDRSLFDYCDLSRYTPQGIAPLLAAHGVTTNNTRWAATEIFKDSSK